MTASRMEWYTVLQNKGGTGMTALTTAQKNRINACVFIILVYEAVRQVLGVVLALVSPAGQMAQLGLVALVNLAALVLPCLTALGLCPVRGRDLRIRRPGNESFLFWLPIFLGGGALINLAAVVLKPLDQEPMEVLPGGLGPVLMVLIIYGLIPAVGEELLFRGVLEGILTPCGKGIALFLPALFFALLHGRATQIFVAFFTGLFLGWLAWRSGSILLGMGLHFANNLLAVGEIYLTQFAHPGLTLAAEIFHFLFWPVAGAVFLVLGFRKGKLKPGRTRSGEPKGVTALGVPACGVLAGVLLVYRILEGMRILP